MRRICTGSSGSSPSDPGKQGTPALIMACLADTLSPMSAHRTRILAKRLRYGIEALRPLLPKQHTEDWYQHAIELQDHIGRVRDVMQACALVARLNADPDLMEFLRGFSAARSTPTPD